MPSTALMTVPFCPYAARYDSVFCPYAQERDQREAELQAEVERLRRQVRENEEAHGYGSRQIPYSELEEATGGFDALRKIGEGGFGSVFFGRWDSTQVCFALYYVGDGVLDPV